MLLNYFNKNYIFLNLLEKNQNILYLSYNKFFIKMKFRFIKSYFKKFKFHFNINSFFNLEKILGKFSKLNIDMFNAHQFYWYKKQNTILLFHILEKYIYNEFLFYYLNLWKYKFKKNYGQIKIIKLILLSKKLKYTKEVDFIELSYKINLGLIQNNHISLFLPFFF